MKFRALLALSSVLVLAGCGSKTAASPTATVSSLSPTTHPTSAATQPSPTSPTTVPTGTSRIVATGSSYDRGQAYLRAGQYATASHEYNQWLRSHPTFAAGFYGLGNAEWGQQHFQNAYVAYRKAAQLDPHNAEYVYKTGLAALYVQNSNSASNPYVRAAIAYASRYIRLQPTHVAGYHLRFLAYGQSLNRKMQLPDAQSEVKLEPRNPDSYNDLGIALANNAKYARASAAFTRAIMLQPSYYAYYIDRAEAENLNKQQSLAMRDLRKAQALAPDAKTRQSLGMAIASLTKAMQHQK